MSVTFDGPNKLIIADLGTTELSVKSLYSAWKDWLSLNDNSKFPIAFSVSGGEPIGGGRYTGTTYLLTNGWKIRPSESSHTLTISGNLFSSSGSLFVPTLGNYTVECVVERAAEAQGIAVSGSSITTSEIQTAVWSAPQTGWGSGTIGKLLSELPWIKKWLLSK